MAYDINRCHFSGKITFIKPLATRSGLAMTQFRNRSWKEEVRCVCFREIANLLVDDFEVGDRIEIKGRFQSSNWEQDNVKVYSYQVNVDRVLSEGDLIAKQEPKQPEQKPPAEAEPPGFDPDHRGGPF